MKAKTQTLPLASEEMTYREFLDRANACFREFDVITERSRKRSQNIERLKLETRRLLAQLRAR